MLPVAFVDTKVSSKIFSNDIDMYFVWSLSEVTLHWDSNVSSEVFAGIPMSSQRAETSKSIFKQRIVGIASKLSATNQSNDSGHS